MSRRKFTPRPQTGPRSVEPIRSKSSGTKILPSRFRRIAPDSGASTATTLTTGLPARAIMKGSPLAVLVNLGQDTPDDVDRCVDLNRIGTNFKFPHRLSTRGSTSDLDPVIRQRSEEHPWISPPGSHWLPTIWLRFPDRMRPAGRISVASGGDTSPLRCLPPRRSTGRLPA